MANAEEIEHRAIDRALSHPIGTPPLKELAKGIKKAAIVVEDITRPCPTAQVLPEILTHLEDSGLDRDRIQIIIGTGGHIPMHRSELLKKLGQDILDSVEVLQHQPYENLKYLGDSQRGTPIHINRTFLDADLRIGVGTITPHTYAGFGGGAKIAAVGVAGMDTLYANHRRAIAGEAGGVSCVEGNRCRSDIEEIAEVAGLAFVINGVVNSRRQLAGLFVGDMIEAHRAAVEFARRVYVTKIPSPADIGVFNAYPKDTDLVQSINALNVVCFELDRAVKKGGSVVLTTACPEGAGIHLLESVGMRGYVAYDQDGDFGGYGIIIYSPNLSYPEVRQVYPDGTLVFNRWREVIKELEDRHGQTASATVFPCASLQIPA
jgi:nickel-dependent lactate racemase